jgi:gluconokinase
MTEPGLVVGVDIGTTGVKVAAVDAAAVCHGRAEREYPTQSPRPGWSEQDPDEVAVATADAVREVAAGVRGSGRSIAGVAFSSAMHSLIALGSDGARLTPSVTWADRRAAEQARRLRASGKWLALHRRTGTPVHPMSPLVKLLWFREEQPETWRRSAHWVGIKEYLLFRLTGLLAVDESVASATGLYGLVARNWDEEALELARLRPDQLPRLHASTDIITRWGQRLRTGGSSLAPRSSSERVTGRSPTSASVPSAPGSPHARSAPAQRCAGWSPSPASTRWAGSSAMRSCPGAGSSAEPPTTAATCCVGWTAWSAPTCPTRTGS